MKPNFIFIICVSLAYLTGCYSNESQAKNKLVQTQTTIKFENICKLKKISETPTNYIGWEFKPLDKHELRKCEKVNFPDADKKTRRPFDGDTTYAEHLLKKEYNGNNTSFSRAPTGVDQLARAFGGNERMVALYVDGAGALTPNKIREQSNPLAPAKHSDYDPTNAHYSLIKQDFSGDSIVGSGLGMGDSGVYGKLRQMFRKIYNVIQQKSQAIEIDQVSFNVYGFSRGGCHRSYVCSSCTKIRI